MVLLLEDEGLLGGFAIEHLADYVLAILYLGWVITVLLRLGYRRQSGS